MISWKNLTTLASFQELAKKEKVSLKDVMSGEAGAARVKTYQMPMAEGMTYVYAAKVFMVFNQKDDVDAVLKRAKDADAYCDQLRLLEARHLSKQNKLAEAEKLYLEIDEAVEKEESDIEDPEEFFADI